jgi:hypothetical protein
VHVCKQDNKQQQECALANRAALVKLGTLDALLTLAVGGGGLPSGPVRTQVPATHACVLTGILFTPRSRLISLSCVQLEIEVLLPGIAPACSCLALRIEVTLHHSMRHAGPRVHSKAYQKLPASSGKAW